jgi:hypothetical protein
MVDAFTEALNWMRGSGYDYEALRSIGAMMQAEQTQRRAAYEGSGMFMNAGDLQAIEDGESIDGMRYTNVTSFSRVRGG